MKSALGIIFSDHYGELSLTNELTYARTAASLPYAGRYRTIDFVLSSMVNAQITDIGIITRENYGSLMEHLGNGHDFDLNRRHGGLTLLTPLARPETKAIASRGRLDALRSVQGYIEESRHELIVMAFGGTVANIDLKALIDTHIKNDAYLTLSCAEIPAGGGQIQLTLQPDGQVESISYSPKGSEEPKLHALATYVMRRKDLLDFLDEAAANDYTSIARELIQKNLTTKRIFGYRHEGYARMIRTVEDYFASSMDMLNPDLRRQLFPESRPVYTKIKDSVPTFYDYRAIVENSLIADGCTVRGTVRNSVIFRGVEIEEGAVVENAIIMQEGVVEEGASVAYTIADMDAVITAGAKVQGTERLPFVIGKGKRV